MGDNDEKTRIDPRHGERRLRPLIAPDDAREHRAVVVSPAMLRDMCRAWYETGFRSSGQGFNGETAQVVDSPAVQRLLAREFDFLWNNRYR